MTDEANKPQDFNFNSAHRTSYMDLLEPTTYVKGGKWLVGPGPNAYYRGTFLIEPDDEDLAKLKADVNAMLQQRNKTGKKMKVGRLTEEQERTGSHIEVKVPWSSGDKLADKMKAEDKDGEIYRGKVLVKASSKFQPALAALDAGKLLEFNTPESIAANGKKYFYSGAYMVPSFGLHWYKGDEGKPDGVSLYLNAVMFAKHGPRLGGRSANAAETFKGYIGSIKDEDPTGGAETEELDDAEQF